MKNNVLSKWSPEKINAMMAARGCCRGHIAVLASCDVGNDEMDAGMFSCVVAVDKINRHDAVANLKSQMHPSIGIYAIVPSCNPNAIVEEIRKHHDNFANQFAAPRPSHGFLFHPDPLDGILSEVRRLMWEMFAEQWDVTILDEWGENTTA